MTEQDELAQLLQATARGDRNAFARLYELTAPRLLAAGMHMLRRREFAEDVLQDLFVKVWHRASEYHAERGGVLTWLYSVQRYLALDRLRAQRPTQEIDDELSNTLAFEGPDPAALAVGSDMAARVHGCLEQLDGGAATHRDARVLRRPDAHRTDAASAAAARARSRAGSAVG